MCLWIVIDNRRLRRRMRLPATAEEKQPASPPFTGRLGYFQQFLYDYLGVFGSAVFWMLLGTLGALSALTPIFQSATSGSKNSH